MSVRKLFGLLIALAVLMAPSAAFAEHMAMTSGHPMQMMQMGHCDGPPSSSDHDKVPGKNCCISMCTAAAITPDTRVGEAQVEHVPTYFATPTSWHGFLGEIATPPPRTA